MGRICNIYPDPAGVVRKADVITASVKKTIHAINQLVLLLPEEEVIDEVIDENPLRRSTRNKNLLTKFCLT